MKVVILAGGLGSRLRPLSVKETPKQFLKLYGNKSLIEHTYDRVVDLVGGKNIFISTRSDYKQSIISIFTGKDLGGVIIEPEKKNTGPAMLFCMKTLYRSFGLDDNESVVFLPADHIIKPLDLFMNYLSYGSQEFGKKSITVFGIVPRSPNTGYGYIKAGKEISQSVYHVDSFTEKPDHETATGFLKNGGHFWNSGIYMCSYNVLIKELEIYYPQGAIYLQGSNSPEVEFSSLDPVSFDYMIAEKTANAVVVPMSVQRSDVGTWEVIDEISEKNKEGNIIVGDVQIEGVENTYVSSEDMNIKLVGVEGLIVVQQGKNIMIAKKGKSDKIKDLL